MGLTNLLFCMPCAEAYCPCPWVFSRHQQNWLWCGEQGKERGWNNRCRGFCLHLLAVCSQSCCKNWNGNGNKTSCLLHTCEIPLLAGDLWWISNSPSLYPSFFIADLYPVLCFITGYVSTGGVIMFLRSQNRGGLLWNPSAPWLLAGSLSPAATRSNEKGEPHRQPLWVWSFWFPWPGGKGAFSQDMQVLSVPASGLIWIQGYFSLLRLNHYKKSSIQVSTAIHLTCAKKGNIHCFPLPSPSQTCFPCCH